MAGIMEYELLMDPADLRWFRSHVGTERCFPGLLQVGAHRWPMWLGYRGRFSRHFPKPSYDIWFDQGRSFDGHAQLHLNAAYSDPSLLRGRLAFEVFASLGVPVPRAWHVWLSVNGEPLGLYTTMESIDANWLQREGTPNGTIYYGVGGEGNFGLINPKTGRPKKYLVKGYEKCHPVDDDFSDLEDLILRITLPDDLEFEAGIGSTLDVDTYLRWLIGVVFTSHTDGLIHNYALLRPQGGLWRVSPWDCDGTWGRCPDGSRLPADYMGLGSGNNYLVARLLASRRWHQRYAELWEELLADTLTPTILTDRLHALYTEIRKPALQDQNKAFRNSTFLREPALIRDYVAKRTAFIRQHLANWREPAQGIAQPIS